MNKYIFLIGQSATGKDTILKKLLSDNFINLKQLHMYTTRPMRQGEVDGLTYYFTNDEKFDSLDKEGKFLEKREFKTKQGIWKYATEKPTEEVEKDTLYICTCTLLQYELIMKSNSDIKALLIFLEVPGIDRLTRSINRVKNSPTVEKDILEICRRYVYDADEFSDDNISKIKNLVRIKNRNLDEALLQIKELIKQF